MTVRTGTERIADAVRRLESDANVWVATASADGVPHLIPLSLAWIDGNILVSTSTDTPTVRNVVSTGRARATLESATDVVIVDADATAVDVHDAEASYLKQYVGRVGWDPRDQPNAWTLLSLAPRRVQAWNGLDESVSGRVLMRDGDWTT